MSACTVTERILQSARTGIGRGIGMAIGGQWLFSTTTCANPGRRGRDIRSSSLRSIGSLQARECRELGSSFKVFWKGQETRIALLARQVQGKSEEYAYEQNFTSNNRCFRSARRSRKCPNVPTTGQRRER